MLFRKISYGFSSYHIIDQSIVMIFYAAATPLADAPFVTSDLTSLKKGYWQYHQAELHNKLRIMAQSPLSFVSQGTGDLIVEELGITDETIFCAPEPVLKTCVDFNVYRKIDEARQVA